MVSVRSRRLEVDPIHFKIPRILTRFHIIAIMSSPNGLVYVSDPRHLAKFAEISVRIFVPPAATKQFSIKAVGATKRWDFSQRWITRLSRRPISLVN